jgi:hypothetical protein
MVPDRREVGVHQVGDDRRGLAEEQSIDERAGADVVAGDDADLLVAVRCLLVLDRPRQPRRATGELTVDVEAGIRLEVAVKVVPCQQVDVGRTFFGALELNGDLVSQ